MRPLGAARVSAMLSAAVLALGVQGGAAAAADERAAAATSGRPVLAARQIAPDVFLIPGDVPEERGPDGNTIILRAPDGLIVVDTGRHVQHSDAILAFAAAERRPIAAIVNTHWHLDHSSGNRRLKAVFADAPVITGRAIDRALAEGGFLAKGVARAQERLARTDLTPLEREETGLFIATMAAADSLRPTLPIDRSQSLRVAGKVLDVRLAANAVSDGDVWLYDATTRVAIVGDLVTLPAPFLDTACPRAWSAALDEVAATPFAMLVPGHGAPMTRAQFEVYRSAFDGYLACVASERSAATCGAGWAAAIVTLEPDDARLHAGALPYAQSYAEFLRENGGKSPSCLQAR